MEENKLLASVAVFREVYDGNKDIYDVIGEFIKAAILFERKWSFNSLEVTQILGTTFGFDIPEAVVRTTLKKRLEKRDKILSSKDGVFVLIAEEIKGSQANPLLMEHKEIIKRQGKIVTGLIDYYREKSGKELEPKEKSVLIENFYSYLLDDDATNRHSGYISSYIIDKQSAPRFADDLNAIREGLVLYDGIRYSPDLNSLGTWKSNINIYLDTEHLFNSVGYNGKLQLQMFEDFYNLVKEVNKNGKRIVVLKYFEECKGEVESFFHVAELIKTGKVELDPSKTAMVEIVEGCDTKSDVLTKKAIFYVALDKRKITLATEKDYYKESKYSVESQALLDKLKQEASKNAKEFIEDKTLATLKMFTKINYLRKGANSENFEKIKHVLMSGNSYTLNMAFDPEVQANAKDVPFATNMEFITNRFWFKLHKGLSGGGKQIKTLDAVTRAQVVLSSQLKNSVSEKYYKLQEDYKSGKISKEEAEQIHHELRGKSIVPENITPEITESALEFIDHTGFEEFFREKTLLENLVVQGEEAIRELDSIRRDEYEKKKKKKILRIKLRLGVIPIALVLGAIILAYVVKLVFDSLVEPGDTKLAKISFIVPFIVLISPLALSKIMYRWIKSTYTKQVKEISIKE